MQAYKLWKHRLVIDGNMFLSSSVLSQKFLLPFKKVVT